MNPTKGIMIFGKDDVVALKEATMKWTRNGYEIVVTFNDEYNIVNEFGDDIYLVPNEAQKKAIQKLELKYKGKYKMRDNNCKANHDRGLQKRIDNYNTMQTVNTMSYNPSRVALKVKQKFYGNVLKMLKLA